MVSEDKTLQCPLQVQNKLDSEYWGWGHLSPVPRLWGLSLCPPPQSSIPLLLPLQIPCSLVAKLISISCAPLPRPDPEKLKREPLSMGYCLWAYVIGLVVNEKIQNTGESIPFFLRGVDLMFFSSIFSFQAISKPIFPYSITSILSKVRHSKTCVRTMF